MTSRAPATTVDIPVGPLPDVCTTSELQGVDDIVLGTTLDDRSSRRTLSGPGLLDDVIATAQDRDP